MSFVRIWAHLVFATKNRFPYLKDHDLRFSVFRQIKQIAEEKGIWLDCVNGYQEHTHCLISLKPSQSISQIAKLIKGSSSAWINKHKLTEEKFFWQDDYYAVSVSESHLPSVREYIYNQEVHHRSFSFTEEINGFTEQYGWKLVKK